MNKQREALQVAIKTLEHHGTPKLNHEDAYGACIASIREALAEPEQEPVAHHSEDDLDMVMNAGPEPVAWMCPHDPERETAFSWRSGMCESSGCGHQRIPLYNAPPTRKPLTNEHVMSLALQHDLDATWSKTLFEFVRAIERAHGIGE